MRLAVGVLALAVVGEGLLLVRVQRRLDGLVQRLNDVTVFRAMGLGERPGELLLLLDPDGLGVSVEELQALQAHVDTWRQGFVQRHQVGPEQAEILAGALGSHVTKYGDNRLQLALGAIRPDERKLVMQGLQERMDRTALLLLGEELGTSFAQEFGPVWQGWTAAD